MADPLAITLHASAEETASGSAAAVDLWDEAEGDGVQTRRLVDARLTISAISGQLTVSLETSDDQVVWSQVGAFPAKSATGNTTLATGDFGRYIRCSWTLSAGGSATFAVTGTALETFCTLAELRSLGAARSTIQSIDLVDRIEHLVASTEVAKGYLKSRHTPPIISVGLDVAQAVAKMATLSLLTDVKGVNPHPEATALVLDEARAKERWLRDVSHGLAAADVVDSTPEVHEGTGSVSTGTSRGWGSSRVV